MGDLFTIKNIIIYILFINLLTFFNMGLDKQRAKKGKWRTKESTLFILVLMGGGIGGIAGIYTFRHKTQNKMFTIGFPLILIIELVLVIVNFII
ncbi:MAG: DUF1294 domain-containing protein [Clostridia bacterium]|nr:DUF1294 domain-containing protein [Clostridia bacterium]